MLSQVQTTKEVVDQLTNKSVKSINEKSDIEKLNVEKSNIEKSNDEKSNFEISNEQDDFEFIQEDDLHRDPEEEMRKFEAKLKEIKLEEEDNTEDIQDGIGEEFKEEELENVISKLSHDFGDWLQLRKKTIASLRDIADYIDSITFKSSVVKVAGSGTGVLAGSLTIAGGILTILSAGVALPILLAGTGIGLAAGLAGGTAAITEKIIKSRQMSAAKIALETDHAMTQTLETSVALLRKNRRLATQVTKHVILSGGSAVSDSLKIAQLVAGKSGAVGTIEAGIKATAKILGEDVSKEVSKMIAHTSGRVLSGAVTVVFGGATMIYDIYRLTSEVQTLASKGKDGANDIRTIANELENSLEEFLSEDSKESELDETLLEKCQNLTL